MAQVTLDTVTHKNPPTTAELIELQNRIGVDLLHALFDADPWNHYYPNLSQGLNSFLSDSAPNLERLAHGLCWFHSKLDKLLQKDNYKVDDAPGFNAESFLLFFAMLGKWKTHCQALVSQVTKPQN